MKFTRDVAKASDSQAEQSELEFVVGSPARRPGPPADSEPLAGPGSGSPSDRSQRMISEAFAQASSESLKVALAVIRFRR
jgi:hypothetical protein